MIGDGAIDFTFDGESDFEQDIIGKLLPDDDNEAYVVQIRFNGRISTTSGRPLNDKENLYGVSARIVKVDWSKMSFIIELADEEDCEPTGEFIHATYDQIERIHVW